MLSFESLENELKSQSIELHAAELHGILVGYACGLKDGVSSNNRYAQYEKWLGVEASPKITDILESAYSAATENLGEYSDYELRLLLPNEYVSINLRADAIAHWCSGFLSGLDTSGRSVDALGGDVAEALNDLKTIAVMTVNVPDGEENEVDLAEIEEFVRVIVFMVYAEINGPSSI